MSKGKEAMMVNGSPVLRIYKTTGGTKRVEPTVLRVPTTGANLTFKCLAADWKIESISGGALRIVEISERGDLATVAVSPKTPGYYEYTITLAGPNGAKENVQGNSSPGVLVDD